MKKQGPLLPPDLRGKEVWGPVEGYEYEVSNCGRVRRLVEYTVRQKDVRLGMRKIKKPRLVTPWVNTSGFVVALWKDRKRKMRLVRDLVAETFMHLQPGERVVLKGDDPADCRISNIAVKGQEHRRITTGQRFYLSVYLKAGGLPKGRQAELAKMWMVDEKTIRKALEELKCD